MFLPFLISLDVNNNFVFILFAAIKSMRSRQFIDKLIGDYRATTPSYHRVMNILKPYSDKSDHIALRTFRRNGEFNRLYNILTHDGGWTPRDCYQFPSKKITAQWFSPNHPKSTRIFLSEIIDTDLSDRAQSIINKYIPFIKQTLSAPPPIVDYQDYLDLDRESNYAAWTLIHGTIVNHETIPIPESSFPAFIELMEQNGIELLKTPNVVKVSKDGLLLQASSPADMVNVRFLSGIKLVPGSFVEYIDRLPTLSGERRDGFEADNALQIFDSTLIRDYS
jgi:hypothetical protein